jgi:hypothetical protein
LALHILRGRSRVRLRRWIVGDRLRAEGHDEGYVAIPIRLPTGELTGYLGITEAKLPKEFQLSNVVTFSQEDCLGSVAPRKCGAVLFTCETRTTESCELLIASAH